MVATESLDVGGSFDFDVSRERNADALKAIFPVIPTNAQFVLYFVPLPEKD